MAQIRDLEVLKNGGYSGAGLTQFKLTCPLESFPQEILSLGDTLTQLDLSGTGLSSLPAELGTSLPKLKILFLSNCNFTTFPRELASCPSLEMVAFRSNGMTSIPEDALPPNLRWLILTDNKLTSLPSSIGRCPRLQKCMLAGNLLQSLPAEMASCKNLALLRLSANNFSELPSWLFTLPQLAFLSFAGNPCASSSSANGTRTPFGLAHVPWSDLEVQHTLGSGASGVISQALWKQTPEYVEEVAVKLFRGSLTSDGTPADEMAACLAAGCHESLITILGKIHDHPEEEGMLEGGLVMQLIPDSYKVLGQPPSLDTCTRDLFPSESTERLQTGTILSMLTGIAGAAAHLHERGIAHGDLYAHNILASKEDAHALLGDFGAATIYGVGSERDCEIEKLEVLAFAHLLEDMLGLVSEDDDSAEGEGVESEPLRKRLWELQKKCSVPDVGGRPSFEEILEELEGMMGWRGMMRIPTIPN